MGVGLCSSLAGTLLTLANDSLQALHEFCKTERFVLSLLLEPDVLHFKFGKFGKLHGQNPHSFLIINSAPITVFDAAQPHIDHCRSGAYCKACGFSSWVFPRGLENWHIDSASLRHTLFV